MKMNIFPKSRRKLLLEENEKIKQENDNLMNKINDLLI